MDFGFEVLGQPNEQIQLFQKDEIIVGCIRLKLPRQINKTRLKAMESNVVESFVQVVLTHLYLLVAALLIYVGYLWGFKYHQVIMRGNYNSKLKNIGRTIPSFPNGWYIACKSKELKVGDSKAIDQSGHNVTVFRATNGTVHALHSYCAHLGANLGIGGKVVNDKCIQCPFHGWLYDGETGVCVDHDNKPARMLNVEYNDDMGSKGCKEVTWKEGKEGNVKLRKYHVKEINGFIYLWLHSDPDKAPEFEIPNVEAYQKQLNNRGFTQHTIYSHAQDIPENGADVFHFKYVHKYPITGLKSIVFQWVPAWMSGDNPQLPKIFEHPNPKIRAFKQELYNSLIKDHKNKEYLSFSNIDNYIKIPLLGKFFVFNLTVMQMGPGLVYVFLKSHFFTILFVQYVQSKEKCKQVLYHEMFASNWLPYFATAFMLRGEAVQVYNDMLIWDAKKFGYRIHYKENQADRFVLGWRKWFSKYYEGCSADGSIQKGPGHAFETISW